MPVYQLLVKSVGESKVLKLWRSVLRKLILLLLFEIDYNNSNNIVGDLRDCMVQVSIYNLLW